MKRREILKNLSVVPLAIEKYFTKITSDAKNFNFNFFHDLVAGSKLPAGIFPGTCPA
jgi:hypothetical protein